MLHSRAVPRMFNQGEALMRQGGIATSLFVIQHGRVRVTRSTADGGEPIELAIVGPGSVVGEIGVLDGLPRTATVVAMQDTEVLELDADALAEIMVQYPSAAVALLHVVSGRLRDADELVAWYAQRHPDR